MKQISVELAMKNGGVGEVHAHYAHAREEGVYLFIPQYVEEEGSRIPTVLTSTFERWEIKPPPAQEEEECYFYLIPWSDLRAAGFSVVGEMDGYGLPENLIWEAQGRISEGR